MKKLNVNNIKCMWGKSKMWKASQQDFIFILKYFLKHGSDKITSGGKTGYEIWQLNDFIKRYEERLE